jgi:MarR family transcriptional regulator, transcriptional regulator for hemolysin
MKNKNSRFFYLIEEILQSYRRAVQAKLSNISPGLTFDQLQLLRVFFNNQNYSLTEASEALLKDTASITRMADLLVKKGYLLREAGINDKRSKRITLTDSGKIMVQSAESLMEEVTKKTFRGLDGKQLKKQTKALRVITDNLAV